MQTTNKIIFIFFSSLFILTTPFILSIRDSFILNYVTSINTGALVVSMTALLSYLKDRDSYILSLRSYAIDCYASAILAKRTVCAAKLQGASGEQISKNIIFNSERFKSDILSQAKFNFIMCELNNKYKKATDDIYYIQLVLRLEIYPEICKMVKYDKDNNMHTELLNDTEQAITALMGKLDAFIGMTDKNFDVGEKWSTLKPQIEKTLAKGKKLPKRNMSL
jgi:hypothetical protein